MVDSENFEELIQKQNYTIARRFDNETYKDTPTYICEWGSEVVEEVKELIDWRTDSIPSAIPFTHKNTQLYFVNSTPLYWTYGDIRPLRSDLVVIAKTQEEALQQFDDIVEKGNKLRESRTAELLPFFKHIQGDENIKLILGRGTAYDSHRVYFTEDDLDVMLFIEWQDGDGLQNVLENLKNTAKTFGDSKNIEIGAMSFMDQKDWWTFSNPVNPRFSVNLDFIPAEFLKLARASKKMRFLNLNDPYIQYMFRTAVFIGGENKVFGNLKEILNQTRNEDSNKSSIETK